MGLAAPQGGSALFGAQTMRAYPRGAGLGSPRHVGGPPGILAGHRLWIRRRRRRSTNASLEPVSPRHHPLWCGGELIGSPVSLPCHGSLPRPVAHVFSLPGG
jgi:hypothetical protein